MPNRMTMKSVKEQHPVIIKIGFCNLQEVLKFLDRDGYCAGAYGWKCDIYRITNDVAISTGYDPFGNKAINREICDEITDTFFKQLESTQPCGHCWTTYRNIAITVIRDVLRQKGLI